MLEVTIVLCLMFGAFSISTLVSLPSTTDQTLTKLLKTKLSDSYYSWWDTPDVVPGSCVGSNRLERMALEGLRGDSSTWDRATATYRPAHDIDLVISNRVGHLPVQGSGDVVGTSITRNWDLDQTYVLPLPSSSHTSGSDDLGLSTPLVSHAHLARLNGEAVQYDALIKSSVQASHRVAWAPTADVASTEALEDARASESYWSTEDGQVDLDAAVGTEHVDPRQPHLVQLFITVGPLLRTESPQIPEGTQLIISFPPGWRSAGWGSGSLAPWQNTSGSQSVGAPLTLRATMGAGGGGQQTIRIDAVAPAAPVHPFDTVTATLSNGSAAESTLIVTFPVPAPERTLPITLHPTTPYPVGPGQEAIFGVALANGGADAINVTQVDIEIPGGYDFEHNNGEGAPLFAGVTPVSPSEGWTLESPKLIRWTSSAGEPVAKFSAMQFVVKATITSDPSAETAIEPVGSDGPNITLGFGNDYVTSGASWGKSPGIVTLRVPPASKAEDAVDGNTSDGYPWPSLPAVGGEDRSFVAYANDTMAHLRKVGSYTVSASSSDVVNLETAMANATLEAQQRKVPVGTTTWVEGDFESLITTLQQLGVASTLTLDLYAPPSLGCAPTASWDVKVSDLPGSGISAVLVRDIDGIPAALVGTEDGYLYRVGLSGAPVWGKQLAGAPTALSTIQTSNGDDYILAGTSGGKLQWLDAEEGTLIHTESVVVGSGTTSVSPVREIVTDGTTILAAAGRDLVRFGELGGEVAGHEFLADIVDIAVAGDDYDILTLSELSRTTHMLAPTTLAQPPLPTMGGVALAVSDGLVMVAWDGGVEARDRSTNAQVAWHPSEHTITRAAEGSATDDDITDLVYARSDSTVAAVSGADGSIAWIENNLAWNHFGGVEDLLPPEAGEEMDCVPLREPASYTTPILCGGSADDGPLAVAAGGQTALVGLPDGAGSRLFKRDSGGTTDLDSYASRLSAVGSGSWLGAPAFVAGDSAGTARIYPAVGDSIQMQASDRVGRFSIPIHIPLGGFFGSNLVVATLSWDLGGTPMEAKLVDWFEVVAPDGSVVDNPIYTLGLTASQRDRPVDGP